MHPDTHKEFAEVMKTVGINWPRLLPSLGGMLNEEFDGDPQRLKDFLSLLVDTLKDEQSLKGRAGATGNPDSGAEPPPATPGNPLPSYLDMSHKTFKAL